MKSKLDLEVKFVELNTYNIYLSIKNIFVVKFNIQVTILFYFFDLIKLFHFTEIRSVFDLGKYGSETKINLNTLRPHIFGLIILGKTSDVLLEMNL